MLSRLARSVKFFVTVYIVKISTVAGLTQTQIFGIGIFFPGFQVQAKVWKLRERNFTASTDAQVKAKVPPPIFSRVSVFQKEIGVQVPLARM